MCKTNITNFVAIYIYYQPFACVCISKLKLHFICFSLNWIGGYGLGWRPNEEKDDYHLVVYLKFDDTRDKSNLHEELVKCFDEEIIKCMGGFSQAVTKVT